LGGGAGRGEHKRWSLSNRDAKLRAVATWLQDELLLKPQVAGSGRPEGTCLLADRCPTRRLEGGQRVLHWKPAEDGYKLRSGIESTNSEYTGRHGARKLRVCGLQRVCMMVRLNATVQATRLDWMPHE